MTASTRQEILAAWRRRRASGHLLSGGLYPREKADYAVLTHLSAGSGPRGGILTSLMPFADANSAVLQQAHEAGARASAVPLLAGVCGTDPLRLTDKLLGEIKAAGFAGVQNFPTVGLIDGCFRTNLEETSLGYGKEVEMIGLARGLDLLTLALVFTPEEGSRMAQAGADGIVIHPGLGPARGAKELRTFLEGVSSAARAVRKDILALAYGPPVADAPVDGFQED